MLTRKIGGTYKDVSWKKKNHPNVVREPIKWKEYLGIIQRLIPLTSVEAIKEKELNKETTIVVAPKLFNRRRKRSQGKEKKECCTGTMLLLLQY